MKSRALTIKLTSFNKCYLSDVSFSDDWYATACASGLYAALTARLSLGSDITRYSPTPKKPRRKLHWLRDHILAISDFRQCYARVPLPSDLRRQLYVHLTATVAEVIVNPELADFFMEDGA